MADGCAEPPIVSEKHNDAFCERHVAAMKKYDHKPLCSPMELTTAELEAVVGFGRRTMMQAFEAAAEHTGRTLHSDSAEELVYRMEGAANELDRRRKLVEGEFLVSVYAEPASDSRYDTRVRVTVLVGTDSVKATFDAADVHKPGDEVGGKWVKMAKVADGFEGGPGGGRPRDRRRRGR